MTHIVYLIHNLGVGGPQRLILDMATRLDASKFRVTVISLTSDLFLTEAYDLTNINIISLKNEHLRFYDYILGVNYTIYKILKKLKPDIVHTHLWSITCLVTTLSFLLRIKWIHTIHTSGGYFVDKTFRDFIYRTSELLPLKLHRSIVISISNVVNDVAVFLKVKRLKLIYNGVNTARYCYYSRERIPIKLVFVARNQESKGHKFLIEAMAILVQQHPYLRLLLVGGDLKDTFLPLIKVLKLQNNIVFLGNRNDVPDILADADIGVFPSLFEGMPLSLCEMMSTGLPIVAFDIPPVREVGADAIKLTPVGDVVELSRVISQLLSDKLMCSKLGIEASERVKNNFSLEKMIKKHEELYLSLV